MPDVVIAGAGPVGAVVAALLQRSGVDVAVYERRDAISSRPRAVGTHPPAVAVLRDLGLELPGARVISRGEARDGDSILGSLEFDPPVLTQPQHLLQAELDAHLRHVRRGTPVLSVDDGARSARVHLPGGSVGAQLVIAADGVDSSIRAALGIRRQRWPGHARYLMADIDDGHVDTAAALGDAALLWFARGGVVESFPLPGSRRRWVARTAKGTSLSRIVAERTGVRLGSDADQVTTTFTAQQHLARRWVSGRVILLGDAAHEVSPIGGQGMNLGILDAAALAPRIVDALNGDADALPGWERARRRSAQRAMAQAAFNMAVGTSAPRPLHPIKRGGIRALAHRPIAPHLSRAFTMTTL
ncbi:NAD(P)/FAD-dependent oxidoreductase [Microbacterium sp. MPKO10]|uniref:FAD-dependent oxidoreductase n=1 Tax=Microbacterium sp. MPKO10 TaxID=2989818 RepID=UPI002235F8AB|nr:NAD(P)/FAD-dependent oxidoreductase [Microbacterium sp. MPKO10]MCW4456827.1 FAD-dependent monooxygenase [Microbacterium sp. MPKO10]